VRPAPKKKPPRYDRRKHTIDTEDPDLDKKDKDLSMNYKDIGGSSGHPLDAAISLVAMRLRGLSPSMRDVVMIRRGLEARGVTASDLTNPRLYPVLASATLNHLDSHTKLARYLRVRPSGDGRRFEMGPPVMPRDPNDPLKPLSTKWRSIKPAAITEEDHKVLVAAAKKLIDKTLLEYNRDVAFRNALDMAISTVEDGKYDHMLDAANYLAVLNKLANAKLDLTKDTYVADDVNTQKKPKTYEPTPFDPHEYFGKQVNEKGDVHKDEPWRKHFDHPGPYDYNPDEPYMKDFVNRTV
jgi:hypothetical protein